MMLGLNLEEMYVCITYIVNLATLYIFSMQEIVVWGWDPNDSTNHYGYQGSLAGYPFTSNSGEDCIVWVTGEEAFLECVKTVSSSKKRTSAGFWGFGQWVVLPISSNYCPMIARPF